MVYTQTGEVVTLKPSIEPLSDQGINAHPAKKRHSCFTFYNVADATSGNFHFFRWQTLQLMSIIKLITYDCLILGKNVITLWKQLNKIRTHFQWISWAWKSPNIITALRLMTIIIIILQYHERLRTKYKVQTMHSLYCASGMLHVCKFKYYNIFNRPNFHCSPKKTSEKQLTFWTDSIMCAIPLSRSNKNLLSVLFELIWNTCT